MIWLLGWVVYGLIVGWLAKIIHKGEDPIGFFPTIGIGIAGSFIGGLLKFLLGMGHTPFTPAGFLMGLIGAVIFCWLYSKYNLKRFLEMKKREN